MLDRSGAVEFFFLSEKESKRLLVVPRYVGDTARRDVEPDRHQLRDCFGEKRTNQKKRKENRSHERKKGNWGGGDASSLSVIDAVAQYSGAVAAQFFDRSQSTTEPKVI